FVGNLLIEIIFNLDGLGLLGFEAVQQRDYPVIFGALFFLTLFGLILRLICDVVYRVIDPRIDFESRGAK
ncbi:MAG: ABC transporter permease subunit, partial [Acinetobacter guillouiae]